MYLIALTIIIAAICAMLVISWHDVKELFLENDELVVPDFLKEE